VHRLFAACCVLVAACDGTEAPVVSGPHDLYQVTVEHIPVTSQQSAAYGFHDAAWGDGKWAINQLGVAFMTASQQGLGDPQASTDDAIAMHQLELTLDVQRNPEVGGVTSYVGLASAFDPTSPLHDPLVGTADGELVSAGPGELDLAMAPFGTVLPFTLHEAHVELIAGPDDLQATISGAVEPAFVNEELIPSWKVVLDQLVARDCPTQTPPACGCATGSRGLYVINLFDLDHDCVVEVDDLLQNSFLQSATQPDVTFEGEPAVSFGFAVDAAFVRRVD